MDDQWYADGPADVQSQDDHIQRMVWALVDGQLTQKEIEAFEALLCEDEQARRTYVECMQLHADLHAFFRKGGAVPTPADVAYCEPAGAPAAPAVSRDKPETD